MSETSSMAAAPEPAWAAFAAIDWAGPEEFLAIGASRLPKA
jgi:hypothetical protein